MPGRADYLELGDWNAVCFECGRKRKASQLKKHWQGYFVCPEHWEPRQPQDFVRSVPDIQTPPWTQPMPQDQFLSGTALTVESTPEGSDDILSYALATETLYPLTTET